MRYALVILIIDSAKKYQHFFSFRPDQGSDHDLIFCSLVSVNGAHFKHFMGLQQQISASTLLPFIASAKLSNAVRSSDAPAIGAWLRHVVVIAANCRCCTRHWALGCAAYADGWAPALRHGLHASGAAAAPQCRSALPTHTPQKHRRCAATTHQHLL